MGTIDMMGTASSIVLGFLLATAYGTLFHVLIGGPARRLILYVIASWLGFAIGHFVGEMLLLDWFKLGPLNLLAASAGSWIALFLSWWLAGRSG
jgi:fucose permease